MTFWDSVDTSGECWLWTDASSRGYGHFYQDGKLVWAHRHSYEQAYGELPQGIQVDHRTGCNTLCVRPSHLRAATRKQNQENRIGLNANNTSGVRGVTWDRSRGKWRVACMHNGVRINGGRYTDLADAEAAAKALRNSVFTHNERDRNALGLG